MLRITRLTVEQLHDIVESQLCVHGNQSLVFIPSASAPNVEAPDLLVGKTTVIGRSESVNLAMVAERLSKMNDSAVIQSSNKASLESGFLIGFKTKIDGFVETINSNELIK